MGVGDGGGSWGWWLIGDGGDARDGSVLGADRCGVPPRAALHSLSASGLGDGTTLLASAHLLSAGPPENLACGPSDTTLYGSPLRAPGRTATGGSPSGALPPPHFLSVRRQPPHLPIPSAMANLWPAPPGSAFTDPFRQRHTSGLPHLAWSVLPRSGESQVAVRLGSTPGAPAEGRVAGAGGTRTETSRASPSSPISHRPQPAITLNHPLTEQPPLDPQPPEHSPSQPPESPPPTWESHAHPYTESDAHPETHG
ncbi:MAG: hypothetical protein ACI8RZ_000744 [Myxococcota bacterium]|jgi:hypothetical protein